MTYNETQHRFILYMAEVIHYNNEPADLNTSKVNSILQQLGCTISDVLSAESPDGDVEFILSIGRGDFTSPYYKVSDDFVAMVKEWAKQRDIKLRVEIYIYCKRGTPIDDMILEITKTYLYSDRVYIQIPCDYTAYELDTLRQQDFAYKNKIYVVFMVPGVPIGGQAYTDEALLDLLDILKPVDFVFSAHWQMPPGKATSMKQALLLKRML